MKKAEKKREFLGVWIPKAIWLNTEISALEKVFLAEINSLNENDRGCYASNKHFAEMFSVSYRQVSRTLGTLVQKGLIGCELEGNDWRKRKLYPLFYPDKEGIDKNDYTPIKGEKQGSENKGSGQNRGEGIANLSGGLANLSGGIDKSVYTHIEENTKSNTKENTNRDYQNKKKISSEKDLVLDLAEKRIGWELEFVQIIRLSTRSEKTTLRRVGDHFAEVIEKGGDDYFNQSLAWAKEAKACGDRPMALWVSMVKERTEFVGKGKRLLGKWGQPGGVRSVNDCLKILLGGRK